MEWTPAHLVHAVKTLFEQNQYSVEGPKHIHGAEVDLIASHPSPFGNAIYMEVTVEYVDNTKYGKDLSKLALVRTIEPNAELLIISGKGFTNEVKERATATKISTLTFEELSRKFERFAPYLDLVLGSGEMASSLASLDRLYEEAQLVDHHGQDVATEFLSQWYRASDSRRWLILVGEYGTGKTALTRVLQRRWTLAHQRDPSLPIPFRIELRDFTRQFDGRGLLHHFLDRHELGSIPVEYVERLIRHGRIVLLLDGYDEMAQYMHARERRSCLEALAELSRDGARGLLTTRPNYFSEAEELHVLDTLYRGIRDSALDVTTAQKVEHERKLDHFFDSYFIKRYERSLKDLTIEQTERLVRKSLPNDIQGQKAVLRILERVAKSSDTGKTTVSGKPVIISYLLNVVEGLKDTSASDEALSEYQVFKMIIDKLMLRDYGRSPMLTPTERRAFLQRFALVLSVRGLPGLNETDLRTLVAEEMKPRLSRLPTENAQQELEILFADLRGSATLTRVPQTTESLWVFSHNSLREFLVLERVRQDLENGREVTTFVKTSDAMRSLAASIDGDELLAIRSHLAAMWQKPDDRRKNGYLLGLFWDGLLRIVNVGDESARMAIEPIVSDRLDFSGAVLHNVAIENSTLDGARFAESELTRVSFKGSSLNKAEFGSALLDGVSFEDSDLRGASFAASVISDIDVRDAQLDGSDFRGTSDVSVLVRTSESQLPVRIEGYTALGWLASRGALTDDVPVRHRVAWHPAYPIFQKIVEKLLEGNWRQVRGLTQRGAAQSDPKLATNILELIVKAGYAEIQTRRNSLVRITPEGRDEFNKFVSGGENSAEFTELLRKGFP